MERDEVDEIEQKDVLACSNQVWDVNVSDSGLKNVYSLD